MKKLICSIRLRPTVDGVVRSWHIEKVAGANVVYTCPADLLESLFFKGRLLEFSNQINDTVPQEVMDKLMKIPYFERGYAEDGYTLEDFNSQTASRGHAENG